MSGMSPIVEEMMYKWMSLESNYVMTLDPGIKCSHLHPDTSCAYEVYYKMSRSLVKGFKFYLILHVVPFLIFKAKKIKNLKKFREDFFHLVKKYIGSLCFMSTLVGSIKVFLCLSEKITKPEPTLEGKVFIWGSLLSSLSILFEDPHRREEIVYFVFIRGLRSAYEWAKKRKYIYIPFEESTAFIGIAAITYYLYDQKRELLRSSNHFEKIWGII